MKAGYLLTGLAFCGICGGRLTGQTTISSKGYRTRYYVCATHHAGHHDRCPKRHKIPADKVEGHILGLIREDVGRIRHDHKLHEYIADELRRISGGNEDAREQLKRRQDDLGRQVVKVREHLQYTPEVMISHLERIHREFGFVRASLLHADEVCPSASTYAKHFKSLDTAYQRVFSSTLIEIAEEVETTLRDQVDQIERYDDFLVINRSFTVLVQPSVPVPFGYQQYWYFRPDLRRMIDITLGVPVSGAEGPRILGYLALPRLLVQDRGIRLFGSSETRLSMYGHAGLEIITQLARK